MKVETPQILWHNTYNGSQKENGKNSPLLSCSLLDSSDGASTKCSDRTAILATAGNTEVNLWRVTFTEDSARVSENTENSMILVKPLLPTAPSGVAQNTASNMKSNHQGSEVLSEHTKIEHVVTLSRGTNERTINAVKFSPDGCHLAAAGDGGTVVVWSVPSSANASSSSSSNTSSAPKNISRSVARFWCKKLEKETDLYMKIIFNQSDDVMDIAWSHDSKRFMVCSLDHTLTIYEVSGFSTDDRPEWRTAHRSSKDHTHYIQGVAYDPKGVYMASQGSDRSVKVYSRKNVKENAIKGALANLKTNMSKPCENKVEPKHEEKMGKEQTAGLIDDNALLQSRIIPHLLTNSKFELQNKTKTMKFLNTSAKSTDSSDTSEQVSKEAVCDIKGGSKDTSKDAANAKRHNMFADELTVGSFFRRLSFTADGAFLVVPAALWHGNDKSDDKVNDLSVKNSTPQSPKSVLPDRDDRLSESSFATYLFARHHFDQPYKVLTGLEKPSVVVRPNPVLFQLPHDVDKDEKEIKPSLPYRTIFAVLTIDAVLIYDTHNESPLCMARGLHYSGLTDAAWSADGMTLFVTSSDGYISILSFGKGELGDVFHDPRLLIGEGVSLSAPSGNDIAKPSETTSSQNKPGVSNASGSTSSTPSVQDASAQVNPNETTVNTLVPKKKKKRIAPTLINTTGENSENNQTDAKNVLLEESSADNAASSTQGKEKVDTTKKSTCGSDQKGASSSLVGQDKTATTGPASQPAKKKKRIQPTLVSC